ncbi:MAG TPA: 30S ribosomal protein S16 [Candidatus Vogelbacteria bacterium]|uniref:Small ribosomal subunit protein bS16 n=1 Tax=Candidatus Vogelbacteria bacterium RIFOXYD1_FULL_51_18 TaxID=1802440 RepID=A0A1G2QJW9_9BACT|nr:MAG: 30S ribosomal protein S16 [Parcubacteria group bacterium GW2011_GWF2_52_12]KKW34768.1 MAG: 30S ribosomal protein S16 [Parcubacteria group bacterium GW2011_GWB1_53_43]OHA60369.1 MAG: 30S ribosomal protein S16 [Candidatus Vogelbacteria bacterium RIFOXYD1_FULL_51_18]HBB65686.1 30S ribosomal protein S16 [Candidatus Vogelbacteria bacterium]HBC44291.1 30S ribosomal protein S16 [Candidatus Vogelbacteria bacterium]
MLKIRLQRVGRKNDPSFRIVVAEHTTAAKKPGSFLEVLGNYDPRRDTRTINAARVKHWMERGAQVSGTVHNLLITEKIISGEKRNVLPRKTVPTKQEEPNAGEPKEAEVREETLVAKEAA